jgi:hypothetical protein
MPLTLGAFHPDPLGQAANLTMQDRLTHRSYTVSLLSWCSPLVPTYPCEFVEMRGTQEMDKTTVVLSLFSGSILTKNKALKQCCGSAHIQIFYFWLLDF